LPHRLNFKGKPAGVRVPAGFDGNGLNWSLVRVAPVPVFFLFVVASLGKVSVISMRFHFPPLVVHDFVVVPMMIIVMIGVVVLDSSRAA
jgi:hypothetical protein